MAASWAPNSLDLARAATIRATVPRTGSICRLGIGVPGGCGPRHKFGGWHQREWLFAGFAQDDWRITELLTVNLGLRYEARTPWIELNDRQAAVNELTGAWSSSGNGRCQPGMVGTNGFSRGLYNTEYGLPDLQPRIGFAWSPGSGRQNGHPWRLTISSYMEGTGTNLRLTQNPPFTPPQVEASNVPPATVTHRDSV